MRLPVIVALLAATSALVAQPAQDTRPAIDEYNLDKKGVALKGYDPVAYFDVGGGTPAKGSAKLELTHAGITYRFANEENRAAFRAAPERFEPAYGGWCAYAMAQRDQVGIDPKSFLIEDGKLLLFYKGLLNNTRKKWLKEGAAKLKPKADAYWSELAGASRDLTHYNLRDGLALDGYDPVSYFAGDAPARGKESIESTHEGARYLFASEENRKKFEEDPQRFEPQFGGYCAWAMSQGKKVAVDATAFTLTDGRLMLFYNADKRDEWTGDTARLLPEAERHWNALQGKR